MGSPVPEAGRADDEKQIKVTVDNFSIGAAEVTVRDFSDFVSDTGYKTVAEQFGKSIFFNSQSGALEEREGLNWKNPGFTQEENHPVVHISWYDAVEYCNFLSKKEGVTFLLKRISFVL